MVLVIGTLIAVASSWTAASTDQRERASQAAATEQARQAWLQRPADNPHSRAHYGDYIFRPNGPLAQLDSGLQAVTGRALFTEAHRQNDSVHRPQNAAAALLRFDRLEPSTVLQLLIPLVLVLVGFGSVAWERESGRLRLLWVQGVRPLSLLAAKSLALWSLGMVLCLLVVGSQLAFADHVDWIRTTAYLVLHSTSLWVIAVLVVCVSSRLRGLGTSAAVLLCLWVCGAIVFPRLVSMTANAVDPLPDRDAFLAAMREDREKGLDGHNPSDTRRVEKEEQVLAEYGVDSKENLPINLDGLMMQADEEYGNKVWDRHFGNLEDHYLRQSGFVGMFSFLNPLQATDRLSMSIAGTDLHSHLGFLRQAESYRRGFVKTLNDEHAHGGSKTGDWSWKADPEFYASFESFDYHTPSLKDSLSHRGWDIAALVTWMVGLTALLFGTARQLGQRGVL